MAWLEKSSIGITYVNYNIYNSGKRKLDKWLKRKVSYLLKLKFFLCIIRSTFLWFWNTLCPISPDTEFKASRLSINYMKTLNHGILYLTYVIPILLVFSHAKKNFEILIFYHFFNFRFPHWGINHFLMGIYALVHLIKKYIYLY